MEQFKNGSRGGGTAPDPGTQAQTGLMCGAQVPEIRFKRAFHTGRAASENLTRASYFWCGASNLHDTQWRVQQKWSSEVHQGFHTGRCFDAGVTNFDAQASNLT